MNGSLGPARGRARSLPAPALAPVLVLVLLLVPICGAARAAGPEAFLGRWWLPDGNGQLEVERSGSGLLGRVACLALRDPPAGDPAPVDANNPDPSLRERPILGLALLEGFTWNGRRDRWEGGTIYDPDTGNRYDSRLWIDDDGHLQARGYRGLPAFGRTVTFRSVPPDRIVRDGLCGTPRSG